MSFNYFYPKNIFNENDDSSTQKWYAKHLTVMKETPIYNINSSDATIYRFLYLRTFENPILIKIAIENDVNTLKAIILSGEGGYEPGVVEKEINKSVNEEAIEEIENYLKKMDFWNLETMEERFGMDGSECIFDVYSKNKKYHVINRWSPGFQDRGANKYFIELANFLLKLSGIKISEKDFVTPL